jgi:NhaP-type Na+/H+ or K+/H+ antiporter
MPDFLLLTGLIAIVLTVSALASGLVVRAPLSFPMLFFGLGFALGERGLGLLAIEPHDKTLEAIATLSLIFVLFLDAVQLRLDEQANWKLPLLVLGPGTGLTIAIIALAAWALLSATLVQALLLGAILSSTDPVVLRDVIRDQRIPRTIRHVLGIEAGTNDLVVLPIVLILIAVALGRLGGAGEWFIFGAQLFVLGPIAGFAVGAIGAWVLGKVDVWLGVNRTYQALYGVGLVLGAYAAGVAVGGDGFLAAFAAGLAIAVLNYDLCDCFMEYGETTAEMAMLLAFIFFGAVLSPLLDTVPLEATLGLAAVALGIGRPLALGLVLWRANVSRAARAFLGWFGPRGLNSLLLVLLVVHDSVPHAEWLLAITGIVVMASVVLHGISATPLSAWYGRAVVQSTLPEERESQAARLWQHDVSRVTFLAAADLARRLEEPNPPIVLDVRSRAAYRDATTQIPTSIRVLPDNVAQWAASQSHQRAIVAYCT